MSLKRPNNGSYTPRLGGKLAYPAVFLVGVLIGAGLLRYFSSPADQESVGTVIRQGNYKLIDPLLACEVGDKKEFTEFMPLEQKIREQVDNATADGTIKDIGVYFRDLDTGRWTGVNEGDSFSPASMLKVPIMITYYKIAETDPGVLDKTFTYDGSFDNNAGQTIKPLKSVEIGKTYTAEELIELMIEDSDNNALQLLSTGVDPNSFNEIFSDLGIHYPLTDTDFMSPKTYATFFRVLYSATYLNRTMSEKALELLASPDFPQGIQAGVPSGVTVAQKFGDRVFETNGAPTKRELHDCGIVYQPNHHYLLCVMTKGDPDADESRFSGAIQSVSRAVYDFVSHNYAG